MKVVMISAIFCSWVQMSFFSLLLRASCPSYRWIGSGGPLFFFFSISSVSLFFHLLQKSQATGDRHRPTAVEMSSDIGTPLRLGQSIDTKAICINWCRGQDALFEENNGVSLAEQFPRLFALTFDKTVALSRVKVENWGVIRFRRTLWGETQAQFENLKNLVDQFQLNGDIYRVRCRLGGSDKFQVKSLYLHLRSQAVSTS